MNFFRKIVAYFVFYLKGGVPYARYIGAKVGKDCRVYTTCFGSEPFLVTIGDRVTLTLGVKLITHDGATWLARDKKGRRYRYQPIEIGNQVFVGVNSIIMPGVKIQDKVIVAAGSVVTKSVPHGTVVAGVPAKVIGSFNEIHQRMIDNYVSDQDLDTSISYKKRIKQVVDNSFKDFME